MSPKPSGLSPGHRALFDRFIGDDPERIASYERALANAEVAQSIYDLRTGAGLSQRALAKLVGTTASVICQLEDADYEGHSLSMLRRIAAALGRQVKITFPPAKVPATAPKAAAPKVAAARVAALKDTAATLAALKEAAGSKEKNKEPVGSKGKNKESDGAKGTRR